MKLTFLILFSAMIAFGAIAQTPMEELPYRVIPPYPESYTAENVMVRMVDGLGFRYYWATEGLLPEDLAYRLNEEGRSTRETLEHIYSLTQTLVNSVRGVSNYRTDVSCWTFEELRMQTLNNILETSTAFKAEDADLDRFKIIFGSGDDQVELPFWLQINGPIEDALWHIGQVASYRRSSGNPFNSKVNLFNGSVRE